MALCVDPSYKSRGETVLYLNANASGGRNEELMAVSFERVLRTEAVDDHRRRRVHSELASDNFEEFLEDLSATFVRVAAEDIDTQIEFWLQKIVLSLALDRGTLTQFDSNDGGLWATHQWARSGILTPDKGVDIKRHRAIQIKPVARAISRIREVNPQRRDCVADEAV